MRWLPLTILLLVAVGCGGESDQAPSEPPEQECPHATPEEGPEWTPTPGARIPESDVVGEYAVDVDWAIAEGWRAARKRFDELTPEWTPEERAMVADGVRVLLRKLVEALPPQRPASGVPREESFLPTSIQMEADHRFVARSGPGEPEAHARGVRGRWEIEGDVLTLIPDEETRDSELLPRKFRILDRNLWPVPKVEPGTLSAALRYRRQSE